jgi:hypothetical protein
MPPRRAPQVGPGRHHKLGQTIPAYPQVPAEWRISAIYGAGTWHGGTRKARWDARNQIAAPAARPLSRDAWTQWAERLARLLGNGGEHAAARSLLC